MVPGQREVGSGCESFLSAAHGELTDYHLSHAVQTARTIETPPRMTALSCERNYA
jgi:hypothetical protein